MLLTDRAKFETLQVVVLIDGVKEGDRERARAADLTVVGFGEIEEQGKASVVEASPSGPEEVVTIVYTPGTGGTSKGVELTNSNFVAVMGSLMTLANHGAFVKLSKVGCSPSSCVSRTPLTITFFLALRTTCTLHTFPSSISQSAS